jgi:hypothetical protein
VNGVGLVLLAASLAAAGACARSRGDADPAPPPELVPPTAASLEKGPPRAPRLGFGEGFTPLEVGPNARTWRWMGAHGAIRVFNDGSSRRLRLRGWVPLELLAGPPTIRIGVDGHLLATFVAADRNLDKEITVDAKILGPAAAVVVTIDTSATAHAAGDPRELGIAVERVDWTKTEM